MKILHEQYPTFDGLQSPMLGVCLQFDQAGKPALQILHTGAYHWVTSTSATPESQVDISDSLAGLLTGHLQLQIASIYHHLEKDGKLNVSIRPCQRQTGGQNCGLFAIAFATELADLCCSGTVQLDEAQMRSHLANCLEAHAITPFPRSSGRQTSTMCTQFDLSIQLHCYCRMPAIYDRMQQCVTCKQPYHFSCIGLPEKATELKQRSGAWFTCAFCCHQRPVIKDRPTKFKFIAAKKHSRKDDY